MNERSLTGFPYPTANGLPSAISIGNSFNVGIAGTADFSVSTSGTTSFSDIAYESGDTRGIVISDGGHFTLAPGHYYIHYCAKLDSTNSDTLTIQNASTKSSVGFTTVTIPAGSPSLASCTTQMAVGNTTVYTLASLEKPTTSLTGHLVIIKIA